jgi:serine/threonine-protein kinase HipA
MTTIRVHVDGPKETVPVGTARINRTRGIETTEFTYDTSFLAGPAWEISPDLPLLTRAPVVEGLPGALDDSAPDGWGRDLIARRLAAQARDAGHAAPTPTEVDYLLGVNDFTRQGALRFCLHDDMAFLSESTEVPQLLALEGLLDAVRQVAGGRDAENAVAVLLAAGSGSLGGARPRPSVADGEALHIAKFPQPDDQWDVMRWEAVALDLAADCGLRTPSHRLVTVGDAPVLLVERFDRSGHHRIPYLSARSLIGAGDGAGSDYLELVDGLTRHGSAVRADLTELWRRIAFSVAINNTDDHMRNHAVLRGPGGWTLSPVFDVNPDPNPGARRSTSVAGATDAEDCRHALVASAPNFDLDPETAERYWDDVLAVVARWRLVASRNGIPDDAHTQFAPVLDRWSK